MKKRTTLEIVLIITNIITGIAAIVAFLKLFEKRIIDSFVPCVSIDDDDLPFDSDGIRIWSLEEEEESEDVRK